MCYAFEEGSIFYNQQQKTLSDQGKPYRKQKFNIYWLKPWRNLSDVHHRKLTRLCSSLQRYYFNVSKNDTNTCAFIFDFMKCKSTVKNGLPWLINEDKKLPPKNMSSYTLGRCKIKDNLLSLIPYLDKDFKTQWANIAIDDISNFNKLIALIPQV
jgi:hypothetical protein